MKKVILDLMRAITSLNRLKKSRIKRKKLVTSHLNLTFMMRICGKVKIREMGAKNEMIDLIMNY